jgi:hypothetical protein
MNSDELFKEFEAFENEGPEYLSPCDYAKIRPIRPQQIYQWIKSNQLGWKHCDCGRKVINVEETDKLMRSKGKLPPLREDDNDHE